MLKNFARLNYSLPSLMKVLSTTDYSKCCAFFRYRKTFPASYHNLINVINKNHVVSYMTDETKTTGSEQKSSNEHDHCNESSETMKLKILDMALNHVNECGWTQKALLKGAQQAGDLEITEEMFQNEGTDLVMHFVKQSNQKLVNNLQEKLKLQKESGEELNVNLFVRDAIEYRLRLLIPFINVWAEAMQLLLNPKVLNESSDELSKMVDDIWVYSGDKSSGAEWYAKRGFLAQLYGGLQLVMLTDQSDDYRDTWKFLELRFKNMETLEKLTKDFKENTENMTQILKNFSSFHSNNR